MKTTKRYAYDKFGNMLTYILSKAEGSESNDEYTNKYGEIVEEKIGDVETEYEYDYVGNTTHVFYGDTTIASYTYDFRGNVLTETNALGDTRTITYDGLGRKMSESDFKGNVTTYAYDNAGRLLTAASPLDRDSLSVVKYTYSEAVRCKCYPTTCQRTLFCNNY